MSSDKPVSYYMQRPEATHVTFLVQRPNDHHPWPIIFTAPYVGQWAEHRVSDVVEIEMQANVPDRYVKPIRWVNKPGDQS